MGSTFRYRAARRTWPVALLAGLIFAGPGRADGAEDAQVAVSLGYSSRFEKLVLAGEFVLPVHRFVDLDANLHYLDLGSVRRYVASVDVHVNLPVRRIHPRGLGWVGAGLGLVTDDPKGPFETTTRDGQVNVLAGVGYDAPAAPFLEMRITRKHEVSVTVGVRF